MKATRAQRPRRLSTPWIHLSNKGPRPGCNACFSHSLVTLANVTISVVTAAKVTVVVDTYLNPLVVLTPVAMANCHQDCWHDLIPHTCQPRSHCDLHSSRRTQHGKDRLHITHNHWKKVWNEGRREQTIQKSKRNVPEGVFTTQTEHESFKCVSAISYPLQNIQDMKYQKKIYFIKLHYITRRQAKKMHPIPFINMCME